MRSRGRFAVVLALCVSLVGAGWSLWQSVTWAWMIVERARSESFAAAVKQTFDGERRF